MAASTYQKQYKMRGKKARMALARLARLNQVYGTAYPEQTDLSAGFDNYSAGAASLVGAYPVVEGLPALAAVPEAAGGLSLAGEAIFGEVPTPPRPRRCA